ncbi:MAG: phage late control D family protein [Moorea sp. SIO4A3]|nr:phage late control D family protein [Moorena sp. SIO4A3]
MEIKLRYEGEKQKEATVFKGIIVRHCVQAYRYSSLLTIDLKDAAYKLTTQRKSAVFRDMTDKDIIDKIIKTGGLKFKSTAVTKPKHKEMVQYYCTDWDFILSRGHVNGLWVLVDDGEITVKEPNLTKTEEAKHTFEYGKDEIYEFEMEADICDQKASVESTAWDIKTQKLSQSQKAKEFSLAQGNLKGEADQLAKTIGADNYQLISLAPLDDQEVKAWADAKLQKSRVKPLPK